MCYICDKKIKPYIFLLSDPTKPPWFVIDYCQLGFIGKLFRSSDLPRLVQFFLLFYNDKPVDWLLENVLQTMVCKLDHDVQKCKKEKGHMWIHYKPSLFQHIGTHSSLRGNLGVHRVLFIDEKRGLITRPIECHQ